MANEFDEEAPASERPRKFAEIHIAIWDDGELDMDCVRFKPRPSGRGAPRKIMFENKEKWMEEVDLMAMSKYGLLKFIKDELGLTSEETEERVKKVKFGEQKYDEEEMEDDE